MSEFKLRDMTTLTNVDNYFIMSVENINTLKYNLEQLQLHFKKIIENYKKVFFQCKDVTKEEKYFDELYKEISKKEEEIDFSIEKLKNPSFLFTGRVFNNMFLESKKVYNLAKEFYTLFYDNYFSKWKEADNELYNLLSEDFQKKAFNKINYPQLASDDDYLVKSNLKPTIFKSEIPAKSTIFKSYINGIVGSAFNTNNIDIFVQLFAYCDSYLNTLDTLLNNFKEGFFYGTINKCVNESGDDEFVEYITKIENFHFGYQSSNTTKIRLNRQSESSEADETQYNSTSSLYEMQAPKEYQYWFDSLSFSLNSCIVSLCKNEDFPTGIDTACVYLDSSSIQIKNLSNTHNFIKKEFIDRPGLYPNPSLTRKRSVQIEEDISLNLTKDNIDFNGSIWIEYNLNYTISSTLEEEKYKDLYIYLDPLTNDINEEPVLIITEKYHKLKIESFD